MQTSDLLSKKNKKIKKKIQSFMKITLLTSKLPCWENSQFVRFGQQIIV